MSQSQIATTSLEKERILENLILLPREELYQLSQTMDMKLSPSRSKAQILLEICKAHIQQGERLEGTCILELNGDGSGYMRWEAYNFLPTVLDIYVSANFIRRYKLRTGLKIRGCMRTPRDSREKYLALDQIIEIEGIPLTQWVDPKPFDLLTPLFPKERLILEHSGEDAESGRIIDLIAPLGKGQRGLIIAPPRVGKTILLKQIAKALSINYPKVKLIVLLIDERPEEVTDIEREVNASVYSSTFDESPARHIQVAELVLERAKRLVELGHDVIILLDSLTRFARGRNNTQPGKGRLLSGGVDSKALLKPKKFFGAARNVEEGGSLTILASVLVDTGSRMDEVIFEEFKGTGNMEIHLDRSLVERRIYPGIHILQSGTRKEDLLYHPDELRRIYILRKQLSAIPPVEALEVLLRNVQHTSSNTELLLTGLR